MKSYRTNEGTYSREETILVATSNEELIKGIEQIALKYNKKIYYAEPNSPDILAVPCFCIIGDADFIGDSILKTFNELFAGFKDKSDKIFLILTGEYELEILLKKVTEAILKMKGIFMYGYEKKYRVSLKKQTSSGYSLSPADFDDLDELKEILNLTSVQTLQLGSNDMIDDSTNIYLFGLKVSDLDESHLNWLVANSYGSHRYLEIS